MEGSAGRIYIIMRNTAMSLGVSIEIVAGDPALVHKPDVVFVSYRLVYAV